MLLPLKVFAPAECVEHMADWKMVAVNLSIEREGGDGYAIAVAVLVNPKLSEALQSDSVNEPHSIAAQVLHSAEVAIGGFLGIDWPVEDNDPDPDGSGAEPWQG